MDSKTYLINVLLTEVVKPPIQDTVGLMKSRLLHACLGLTTEAGEFTDIIKRNIFYGKEIDTVGLIEELGDILWYCGVAIDALGSSFEEVMSKNINKLSTRYKEKKFSAAEALQRHLEEERKVLENKDA